MRQTETMHTEDIIALYSVALSALPYDDYRRGAAHTLDEFCKRFPFSKEVAPTDVLDFSTDILCNHQPENSKHIKHLSEFERGQIGGAYLLYSIMEPVTYYIL